MIASPPQREVLGEKDTNTIDARATDGDNTQVSAAAQTEGVGDENTFTHAHAAKNTAKKAKTTAKQNVSKLLNVLEIHLPKRRVMYPSTTRAMRSGGKFALCWGGIVFRKPPFSERSGHAGRKARLFLPVVSGCL